VNVQAIVDQLELLVPPKIKPEIAEKLSESLKRGEPDQEKIAANITRLSNIATVRELV
jgi:hypothetical protein